MQRGKQRKIKWVIFIMVVSISFFCIYTLIHIKNKEVQNSLKNKIVLPQKEKKENIPAFKTQITESTEPQGNYTYGVQTISEMSKESFWLQNIKVKNQIIMSAGDIEAFNQKIIKNIKNSYDIINLPSEMDGDLVKKYISNYKIPSSPMVNADGKPLSKDFYNEILKNRNTDNVKEKVQVQFGIIKTKTSIRSFPCDTGVYESKESLGFDKFQETGISGLKPIAILNKSLDEKWLFILSYNYSGWVKSEDVFITSKDKLKEICYSKDFIMVKSNYLNIKIISKEGYEESYKLQMGTKIPLVTEKASEYVIKLPLEQDGEFKIIEVSINKANSLSLGYLPYTKENIINQAFTLLGEKYDWGDKEDGRDCSSFICSIYSCFGFELPRNDSEQILIPGKSTSLNAAELGDIIFMKGHVMMFLGKYNGNNYMIHSFTKFKQSGTINNVNKVGITSCSIALNNGVPFNKLFTKIIKVSNGD